MPGNDLWHFSSRDGLLCAKSEHSPDHVMKGSGEGGDTLRETIKSFFCGEGEVVREGKGVFLCSHLLLTRQQNCEKHVGSVCALQSSNAERQPS